MGKQIASLQDIHLTFGHHPLLEGADLMVREDARIALVGRNGSGKSTLLRILAGEMQPDSGSVFVEPNLHVGVLVQEPDLSGHETLGAYAASDLHDPTEHWKADALLMEFGLDPARSTQNLSGGEAKRAALAKVLAPEPDLLLLDEPTNHLDIAAIIDLQDRLQRSRAALVFTSHDRAFANALSTSCVWVDRGKTQELDKGFAHFENWRDEVLEQEELEKHKLARQIVREEYWLRYGVTARRKRNVRRLKELHALRAEHKNWRGPQGQVKLEADMAERSGKKVMELKNVSKSFGDIHPVRDFSIRIMKGERIGIVGPNGAGKTTLVNLITGKLAPDQGEVLEGANVHVAMLDQKRMELRGDMTLQDAMTQGDTDQITINGRTKHVRSLMQDFLFTPAQANTPVRVLSGGERARIQLARAFSLAGNFLVLDEPTNDLDLETLDLLQEMLGDYPGTILLVSHDRDFLDRVATRTLVAEGDGAAGPGRWQIHDGGWSGITKPGWLKQTSSGSKAKTDKSLAKPKSAPKGKLSYKEKYALETLPGQMEAWQADIEKLNTELADPNLYANNPDGFTKLSEQLSQTQQQLDAAEEEWLNLEMKRETLEGE